PPLSRRLFRCSILPPTPRLTLFPYTTLFRSPTGLGNDTSCNTSAAPCMHSVSLNGNPANVSSAPFYDYLNDVLWIGDAVGKLHRSEEHTSELQSLTNLVCRLLLEKQTTTLLT